MAATTRVVAAARPGGGYAYSLDPIGDTMRKSILTVALLVLALVAYLGLWPVPVQPVAWNAPAAPGYTGAHAVNNKLAGLQLISLGVEEGPEHVVLARDGKLYAAVASGKIHRMNPDGTAQEVFANTGGRVLGFAFDAAGHLIAADAVKGLLAISPDRKITVLTDKVGGDPIRYADAGGCGQRQDLFQRCLGPLWARRVGRHYEAPPSWTSSNSCPPGASWSTTPPPRPPASSSRD